MTHQARSSQGRRKADTGFWLPPVLIFLLAGLAVQAGPSHPEFAVAVASDWQTGEPQFIDPAMDWALRNRDLLNIVFLSYQGDTAPSGNDDRIRRGYNALSRLDGLIPYTICAGNHDMHAKAEKHGAAFSKYYPLCKYEHEPWFGGAYYTNNIRYTYELLSAGGIDLLFVNLAFWQHVPEDRETDDSLKPAIASWMSDVLQDHTNRMAIVGWHAIRPEFTVTVPPWNDNPLKRPYSIAMSNDHVVMTWHGHWHCDRAFSSTNTSGAIVPNIVHKWYPYMHYYVFRPGEGEICRYYVESVAEDVVSPADEQAYPTYTYQYGYDFGLPPCVARVWSPRSDRVFVLFNKALDPACATNRANYSIDQGVVITGAQVLVASEMTIGTTNSERTRVRLSTTPLSAGTTYTVAVSNVQDGVGTVIAPGAGRSFKLGSLPEIRGRATMEGSGDPIAGARVILFSRGLTAFSGTNGYYAITNIPPGDYGVSANKKGFFLTPSESNRVSVGLDNVTNVNFTDGPPRNLIGNAGFETGDLSEWEDPMQNGGINTNGHRGQACLEDAFMTRSSFEQTFLTISGQVYDVSVWLRITSAYGGTMGGMRATVALTNGVVLVQSAEYWTETDWTRLQCAFTALHHEATLTLEEEGDRYLAACWDDACVVVSGETPQNQAPGVEITANPTVELSETLFLQCAPAEDNAPSGILNVAWSKISGPGSVSFADSNALNTEACFDMLGAHVLRLTVSDGSLAGTDDVRVVVIPDNPAPLVDVTAPDDLARYEEPGRMKIEVSASDADGVSHVAYFQDGEQLCMKDSTYPFKDEDPPYQYLLTNVAAGVHELSARAYDNVGKWSTSAVTVLVQLPFADSDSDGMDDGWELIHFPNLTVASTNTDYDGDGQLDWQEFVADTVPTNVSSVFGVDRANVTPDGLALSLTSTSVRTYNVYRSTDLVDGVFSRVASNLVPSADGTVSFTDTAHSAESVVYYKLDVGR